MALTLKECDKCTKISSVDRGKTVFPEPEQRSVNGRFRTASERQEQGAALMHRIYVLVLACILAFSGCSDLSLKPEPVRIGLIASLSGKNEPNGRAMEEAATLAVEQINQDGGIRVGRKMRQVALVVRDPRRIRWKQRVFLFTERKLRPSWDRS
jgi:hypothetical protein